MPNSSPAAVPELVTPWGGVGYLTYKRCVDISAPILCADLSWRPAGSLQEGDALLAFDENPREGMHIQNRYLKFATVQHMAIEEADCVGVEIEGGEVFYCTPDHSWLVKMSANKLEWREAAQLSETRFGGPVFIPRVFGKPWVRHRDAYELGYLAGAYDGEGSLDRTNSITFTQVENGMMARVMQYLANREIDFVGPKQKAQYPNRQKCFDIRIHGIKNIIRLLSEIDSVRLLVKLQDNLRKKPQLMRCNPDDYCRVVRVFPAGKRQVAVLQTSSRTHFTWGFPTHNTYARRLNESSPATEEFPQMVSRVLTAAQTQLGCGFSEQELRELEKYLLTLQCSMAGRFNWQLGTKTVDDYGLMSLQNCAVVAINEPIRPFTWAFDALMLGCGVGFNIQREYVYELPKVRALRKPVIRQDTKDADFIVPDSREGWVELLDRVLRAYFENGKGFTYSPILVRGKGALISRFGGVASGPEILCEGINNICMVLDRREGKKIRPIDALDVMCIIGAIVVSGNVRRSALLAMGDPDDFQYLNAKRWDLGDIPNWRAMSNNSVVCNNINDLPDQFWKGYAGNGEPYGLINLKLARSCGRTGETQYKDSGIVGFNPCQPGFATVLTPGGVTTLDAVDTGSVIWSKEGWTTITAKWRTGVKPVYAYRTTTGEFIGTETHRVDTRGGKVPVADADAVLTIAGPEAEVRGALIPAIIADGVFLGDGYFQKFKDRDYVYSCVCIGERDGDYFNSEIRHLIGSLMHDRGSHLKIHRISTSITVEEKAKTYDLYIPDRYFLKDHVTTRSLLRGLYSADGSVVRQGGHSARVTYKTASQRLSRQVQLMLSSIGIRSYITTNRPTKVRFSNGEYLCRESYDVNITRDGGVFELLVGFIQEYKNKKLRDALALTSRIDSLMYGSVIEKTSLGDHEVYDITVDNESHTYWTGGLSVSNCGEQGLEQYETCCLAETFLPNIKSPQDLTKITQSLYRVCKHSLMLPCHHEETEAVVHKNMRMGIGVTGYLQATPKQRSWLEQCYVDLRAFDVEYSSKIGWPVSKKLTTCKPSGTLSLLPGVTPGVHPGIFQYFLRRIQIASNSDLVSMVRDHGYHVEYRKNFDGSDDHTTVVAEFPCSYPEGTPLAEDTPAIRQLEYVQQLQRDWSDNAVSCTVYYKPDELPEIREWLKKNYNGTLKTVSFLLHQGHGFVQAPYEEITQAEYEKLQKKVRPIVSASFDGDDVNDAEAECQSGVCPVK